MRLFVLLVGLAGPAWADPAGITDVVARDGQNGWRFDVTLLHPDTGWDHYADAWRVEAGDGTVLGERILLHPHVQEQPFTRSQSGITIPEGTRHVYIRARCLVDGWGADRVMVQLNR